MTETTPQPAAPRRRLWLRILFVVSLALNCLFIGLFVGAMARFGEHRGDRPPPSIDAALFRELSKEDRREIFRQLREGESGNRRQDRAEDGQAVLVALRAEPFDAAAVEAVLGPQLERRVDWMTRAQAAWLAHVDGMTQAERSDYADRVQASLERRRLKKDRR